jgi:glycosyltransferase involved in cell wall biosynthesis
LTSLKRADLLLRALALPAARTVRAVIGGDGEDRPKLEELARALGLAGRVVFTGALGDDDLAAHYARCRAVVFVPLSEDYGFVTVEAFASSKPVITCRDSGGPTELVIDGTNGLVVPPTEAALAAAICRMMDSPTEAERFGENARRDAGRLSWAGAVSTLMS